MNHNRSRLTIAVVLLIALSSITFSFNDNLIERGSTLRESVEKAAPKNQLIDEPIHLKVRTSRRKTLPIPKPSGLFSRKHIHKHISLDTKERWVHLTDDSIAFEISENENLMVLQQIDGEDLNLSIEKKTYFFGGSNFGRPIRRLKIDGIFGFYHICNSCYVAVITKSKTRFVNADFSVEFKQISEISLISIQRRSSSQIDEQRNRDLELLKSAFLNHQLYFSNVFDVTQSFHLLSKSSLSIVDNRLECLSDDRFFWNKNLIQTLFDYKGKYDQNEAFSRCVNEWVLPVTSAFLQEEKNCVNGPSRFDMLLVSRRGCLRPGMRFTKRGIDENGNVANFVETEQTLFHKDGQMTSHVQVRGSIPLFWSSPANLSYHPPVILCENPSLSLQALKSHITQLAHCYGNGSRSLLFLNLIDKAHDQGKLGEALKNALLQIKSDSQSEYKDKQFSSNVLDYVWFDFHRECKNEGGWDNLNKLVNMVKDTLDQHSFLLVDRKGKVKQWQKGIVRTNCMDCLDRTNVIQSMLARYYIISQLNHINSFKKTKQESKLNMEFRDEFESRFREAWSNNADEISVLYAGTAALKGDYTRTGKRTKVGIVRDGANSIIRYLINNFQDYRRQEAVDFMIQGKRVEVSPADMRADFKPFHNLRSSVDLDLWTKLSLPTGSSNAVTATMSIKLKPKNSIEVSVNNPDDKKENGSDVWKRDFDNWDEEDVNELVVGSIDFDRLKTLINDEKLAKLGLAGFAFISLLGELSPKKLLALLGSLLLVPIFGLLR